MDWHPHSATREVPAWHPSKSQGSEVTACAPFSAKGVTSAWHPPIPSAAGVISQPGTPPQCHWNDITPLATPQTPSTWWRVPAKGYLDLQAGVGERGHRVLGAGHGGHHAGGQPGPHEGQQHRLLSVQRRAPGGCGDTAPRLGAGDTGGTPGGPQPRSRHPEDARRMPAGGGPYRAGGRR